MDETHWTPKLVEARFEEAADTLRRLPSVKVQGYFNTWPPVIRDFWEAFAMSTGVAGRSTSVAGADTHGIRYTRVDSDTRSGPRRSPVPIDQCEHF